MFNSEYERYSYVKHDVPYLYELFKNNKKIYYFGTKHTNDCQDSIYESLDQVFDYFCPELVLVEGIPQINQADGTDFIEILASIDSYNVIKLYGENLYAAQVAVKRKIKVLSPEPSLSDEVEVILRKGISKKSIFLYYICRFIFQWFRSKSKISIKDYIELGILYLKTELEWSKFDFTYENFLSIHTEILGCKIKDNDDVYYQRLVDPVYREENSIYFYTGLNYIARISSIYRDLFLIRNIKKELQFVDKILIVYGATHAYIQKKALTDLFCKL